jgi:calcium/calmodulin-dependent protein kinase I
MRTFNSQYLIHLYEVYETVNSIYLVLDLLKGGDLLKKIPENGYNDLKSIMYMMKNILTALDHMHEKKIMHRDLKPQNILLRSETCDYDLAIGDFGLATHFNIETQAVIYRKCGTPGFVAPEVLKYIVRKN